MQLVVIVLYRVEQMEDLLVHFTEKGIHGATILESTGMATVLGNNEDPVSYTHLFVNCKNYLAKRYRLWYHYLSCSVVYAEVQSWALLRLRLELF